MIVKPIYLIAASQPDIERAIEDTLDSKRFQTWVIFMTMTMGTLLFSIVIGIILSIGSYL